MSRYNEFAFIRNVAHDFGKPMQMEIIRDTSTKIALVCKATDQVMIANMKKVDENLQHTVDELSKHITELQEELTNTNERCDMFSKDIKNIMEQLKNKIKNDNS